MSLGVSPPCRQILENDGGSMLRSSSQRGHMDARRPCCIVLSDAPPISFRFELGRAFGIRHSERPWGQSRVSDAPSSDAFHSHLIFSHHQSADTSHHLPQHIIDVLAESSDPPIRSRWPARLPLTRRQSSRDFVRDPQRRQLDRVACPTSLSTRGSPTQVWIAEQIWRQQVGAVVARWACAGRAREFQAMRCFAFR